MSEIISSFKAAHDDADRNRVDIENKTKRSIAEVIASVKVVSSRAEKHHDELSERTAKKLVEIENEAKRRADETDKKLEGIVRALGDLQMRLK